MNGETLAERPLHWSHMNRHAMRLGNWKLGSNTLFHLEQDPSETTNLCGQMPEKCAQMRASFAQWEKDVAPGQSSK